MEHWEFLLQKDGDRAWLPIDAPTVEILEGRYRMVIRTSRVSTDVAIRISHIDPESEPPKRRVQTRSNRTNSNGLMVLIPYTRLAPGVWEFQCSPGDTMSDLIGETWKYRIRMQVAAHTCEEEADWDPDWDNAADAAGETVSESTIAAAPASELNIASEEAEVHETEVDADAIEIDEAEAFDGDCDREPPVEPLVAVVAPADHQPTTAQQVDRHESESPTAAPTEAVSPVMSSFEQWQQMTEQMSEQLMDEMWADLGDLSDLPATAPVYSTPFAADLEYAAADETVCELKLDRDTFIASEGETLTLSGYLSGDSRPQASEIQVYLRDPQSLGVILHEQIPLSADRFQLAFTLPAHMNTRLVMGEVLLCGTLPGQDTRLALSTQAFTITVNPVELVQELAKLQDALSAEAQQDSPTNLPIDLALQVARLAEPVSLTLSFLDDSESTEAETDASIKPSFLAAHSLKGQPLPPQIFCPTQPRSRSLALPALHPVTEQTVEPSDRPEADPEAMSEPAAAPVETAPVPKPDRPDASETAASNEAVKPLPALPSSTHRAFQALRLTDRFLTRLTSLAVDTDLSAQLRQASGRSSSLMVVPDRVPPLVEDHDRYSQEIVVMDEAPALPQRVRLKQGQRAEPVAFANPLLLPEDEPVPVPELHVTAGELISGQLVNVRVQLPDLQPRIYVKLWVNDRQTRTLLDGPRWLTELHPNGHGALEARTQLTVPFGSVEILVEAMAIELHTNRESHKVSVDRAVVPPDLPALAMDEFEIY